MPTSIGKRFLVLIALFLAVVSCTREEGGYQSLIDMEINQLESVEDHQHFLEQLYASSVGLNLEIEELEQENYFENRNEIFHTKKMRDSMIFINTYRVEQYLKKYPYPESPEFSEEQRLSIYFVIMNEFREKEMVKHLDLFNELYENKVLNKDQYLGYLSRIYALFTSNFFHFDKTQSIEEMIEDIYPEIVTIRDELE